MSTRGTKLDKRTGNVIIFMHLHIYVCVCVCVHVYYVDSP